jgi:hypothetical protein
MIVEFERVALTKDLPEFNLVTGDVGTVVDITPDGAHVTLEFFNFAGDTVAVVPMPVTSVRPLGLDEIVHTRSTNLA